MTRKETSRTKNQKTFLLKETSLYKPPKHDFQSNSAEKWTKQALSMNYQNCTTTISSDKQFNDLFCILPMTQLQQIEGASDIMSDNNDLTIFSLGVWYHVENALWSKHFNLMISPQPTTLSKAWKYNKFITQEEAKEKNSNLKKGKPIQIQVSRHTLCLQYES